LSAPPAARLTRFAQVFSLRLRLMDSLCSPPTKGQGLGPATRKRSASCAQAFGRAVNDAYLLFSPGLTPWATFVSAPPVLLNPPPRAPPPHHTQEPRVRWGPRGGATHNSN